MAEPDLVDRRTGADANVADGGGFDVSKMGFVPPPMSAGTPDEDKCVANTGAGNVAAVAVTAGAVAVDDNGCCCGGVASSSTVSPNSFLSRSVKSSRFGSEAEL